MLGALREGHVTVGHACAPQRPASHHTWPRGTLTQSAEDEMDVTAAYINAQTGLPPLLWEMAN